MFRNAAVVTAMLFANVCMAEDWPQFMGPNRDDRWSEQGLIEKFPEDGPKVLWRQPVGLGYSGPSVVNGKVYVSDYQLTSGDTTPDPGKRNHLEGTERLQCLDAKTGVPIWEYKYPCTYNISYPNGPRATPTVADGKVILLGAQGHLACLDAESGKKLWSIELTEKYNAPVPQWGYSSHPLVYENLVITLAGGQGSVVVALDATTGKEVWKGLTASEIGYAPPVLTKAANVEQLIVWDADNLNSLNPKTGQIYWTEKLKPDYGMSIMPPQINDGKLFASGIGPVGALFELDQKKPGAKRVWEGTTQRGLASVNSAPVIVDGVIYGTDCKPGIFRAVDVKTGERLWQSTDPISTDGRPANSGTAFVVKTDKHSFIMSETGHLIIADLSREGYKELSRAKILEPTSNAFNRAVVWSHPAFADKCCFARNDKEIVCVSLAE